MERRREKEREREREREREKETIILKYLRNILFKRTHSHHLIYIFNPPQPSSGVPLRNWVTQQRRSVSFFL